MALAVCLLFAPDSDLVLRRLWQRLEDLGVPTLLSHTHGLHVPHLSYAVLRSHDTPRVAEVLEQLPDRGPTTLRFDAVGMFRRSRTWLVPAVSADLARRQERVVAAVEGTGADLHQHYRPGAWIPHCTLAPRTTLSRLPVIAATAFEVLPVVATLDRLALIDTGTGEQRTLTGVP